MDKFIKHVGIVAPLDAANVDTDAIIPKQFLQKVTRTGFGQHLFNDWRFLDDKGQQPNPDFDSYLYKLRHLVENAFARLKQFRSIATRYEKLARNFKSMLYLACSIIHAKLN